MTAAASVAAERAVPAVRPTATASGRNGALDGVRALAIALVLVVHVTFQGNATASAGGTLHGLARAAFVLVSHFWLGVDLFFVLSGFLITGILLDLRGRPTYFRDFYVRRALRILPLVVLVLVGMVVFLPGYPQWYVLGAFFLADISGTLHVVTPPGAPPLWSLAVEEQFYLLWPVLVLLLSPRRLALFALALVLAEPIVRFAFAGAPLEVLWCRCDGLAAGALVALWTRRPQACREAPRAAMALLLLAVFVAGLEFAAHRAAVSGALRITEADLLFSALIVLAALRPTLRGFAPFRSRTARFLADTSFCAYLIHVPIIAAVDAHGLTANASPFVAALIRGAWVIPVTLATAAVSARFVEAPILRLRHVLTP